MDNGSVKLHCKLSFRTILIRLFQIFIVLCLIDGFIDISYPVLTRAKAYMKDIISDYRPTGTVEPGSAQDILRPLPKLQLRQEPGIHGIVEAYNSASTNVAADGLRSNGQEFSQKPRSVGLMLGSSTAFGTGLADDQTLAAHLERALENVRVENYAGLAQPLTDNTLRWYDLQNKNGKPDFVIIAGAGFQIYYDCMVLPPKTPIRNIILFLAGKMIEALSPEYPDACNSRESIDLAVRHSVMAVENAIAFGRKQGIPFHIVYLPTPYDTNANVDNLLNDPFYRIAAARMRPVYSRYREELAKLDLPEFIDLSQALPSDKAYFLDAGAHLSADGNKIIADALSKHIEADLNQAEARTAPLQ